MSLSPTEILESFIREEGEAMQQGDWGSFYPDNHHRIKPLLPRAAKLLSENQHIELYFHLLRRNDCPTIKTPEEFQALRAAYVRILKLNHRDPVCNLPHLTGLFLFGYDRNGPLVGDTRGGHLAYAQHLTTWRYITSFTSFPGMLSKNERFKALASDSALVHRATEVVLRTDPPKDLERPTELRFWALVLLAIQDRASGARVAQWLPQAAADLSSYPDLMSYLARFLQAAGRDDLLPAVKEIGSSP